MKRRQLLIYGSYGYTGNLIAKRASEEGLDVLLSGRDESKLQVQAERLNLPYQKAALGSEPEMDSVLSQAEVLLNCAGPFVHTWKPAAEACLRNSCHYLDITGEIPVFESLKKWSDRFEEKGIMAIPGSGFDVVPTDCTAAYLHSLMPDATRLELAFKGLGGGVSRGTAKTMVENLGSGGAIRKNGLIKNVPGAYKVRSITFIDKEEAAVSIPWGDVSTAHFSTGIDNIVVYIAMPEKVIKKMKWLNYINLFVSMGFVKRYLKSRIDKQPPGPDAEQREQGRSVIWGEVENAAGEKKFAILQTSEGYRLTAEISIEIAKRVLNSDFKTGYQTPSSAYGYELIFDIENSEWIKN